MINYKYYPCFSAIIENQLELETLHFVHSKMKKEKSNNFINKEIKKKNSYLISEEHGIGTT
jgi:hypothetical protein